MQIDFSFLPMGTLVQKPEKNKIYLDVGNAFREGIIDHHHRYDGELIEGERYRSATRLLISMPDYVTNHIEPTIGKIEIVLHRSPDFDCFASAYLARYLILNGNFPKNFEILALYAEEVDSGKMRLEEDNIRTPFAIAAAIEEVIKEKMKPDYDLLLKENEYNKRKDQAVLNRGLELIEYMMTRLEKTHGLKHSGLFEEGKFEEEVALLKKDRIKYLEDIESIGVCSKKRILLPVADHFSRNLGEVDALFWNKLPSCILHKYWARQDRESFSGQGYIFTFIPFPKRTEIIIDDEEMSIKELEVNRVIISVDPNCNFSLKGLAPHLEQAEVTKEQNLIGSLNQKRRDFSRQRFNEDWCKNADPWYDGRNFHYTIVDAPGAGSLLQIDEIKEIVLNYTKPRVEKHLTKIVVPFSYEQEKYKELCITLRREFNEIKEFDKERRDYFIPYIQNYLLKEGISSENDYSSHFSLNNYNREQPLKLYCDTRSNQVKVDREEEAKEEDTIKAQINDVQIVLFKYSIGFLIIDTKVLTEKDLLFDELLLYNSSILASNNIGAEFLLTLSSKVTGLSNLIKGTEGSLTYSAILLTPTDFKYDSKEMVFKLSSGMMWEEPFTNCSYIDNVLKRTVFEAEKNVYYGMTKNGGTLIIHPDKYCFDISKQKEEIYWDSFLKTNFDIFILALHQRKSLMDFNHKLTHFDNIKKKSSISTLRQTFLEFTTQSWFTQITDHELGMELYRRWQEIFENQVIFEEVSGQLETADDYYRAQFSKLFETISVFAFPLVLVGLVVDLGFIKVKGWLVPPIGGLILVGGVYLFFTLVFWTIWNKDRSN